jgi:tryptophan synthase beta chain
MVKVSSEQKPYRKALIETYGAELIPSPSNTTESGKKILEKDPSTGGSLGCAISEAVERAVKTDKCRYVLGSVLNHVLLHQSVIGQEAKAALDKYGIKPDIIIGCAGGGSNLGGLIAPFIGEKIAGKSQTRFIAVEPASCPSFTRGRYAYDFGDTAKTTPLLKMCTLGNGFIPSSNHAGGLRYHGMNSVLSKLYKDGWLEARSEFQTEVFDAAVRFMKAEGILPAPESSHAIKAAMDEALECKRTGEKKVILFGLTGTGYFDLTAYTAYNTKTMTDHAPTDAELEQGFASIPDIPQNR